MYNILIFLMDMWIQIQLRIRIFIKDKMTMSVYVLALLSFLIIFISLNIQAEEKSSIPIGVVNYDYHGEKPSSYSETLINNLKKLSSLYVYQGDFEYLNEMLHDGYINSLYVIESGYHENIKKGNINELISVYKGSKSNFAMLVSDIVAGEMMYQICLEKGFIKYRKYPAGDNGKHSEAEYKEYAEMIRLSDDINFGFLINYRNGTDNSEASLKIDNSVLYRQMIAGIAVMIFSFIILFALTQNVIEKENNIYNRKKLTLIKKAAVSAANICTVLLITSVIILVFAGAFIYYASADISLLKILYLSIIYCLIIGVLFEIISKFIKSVFWFQLTGSFIIILFGIVGFCSVLQGIAVPDMGIISDIVPNAWFIKAVTKSII